MEALEPPAPHATALPAPSTSPHADPQQVTNTWSSILCDDSTNIKIFKPTFETVEGKATANLPTEIIRDSVPLWKNYIIGHFIGDPPHIGTIHAIVNKIWATPYKKIDVNFNSKTSVLFRVEDGSTRHRILKKQYWHIAEVPIVIHEWKPETTMKTPDLTSIPLWVDFGSVPGDLYSFTGLSYIGSIIGKPIKLHPNTERCARLDIARLLIEVNLNKPLPSSICLRGKDGENIDISVSFPKLPQRCSTCRKWGHGEKSCPMKNDGRKLSDATASLSLGSGVIVSPKKTGETKSPSEIGNPLVEAHNGETSPPTNVKTTIVGDTAWTTVSKNSKHSSREKHVSALASPSGSHSISPSRFSILADIEEGEIEETHVAAIDISIPSLQVLTNDGCDIDKFQVGKNEIASVHVVSQEQQQQQLEHDGAGPSDCTTAQVSFGGQRRRPKPAPKPIVSKRDMSHGNNSKKASSRKL